MTDEELKARGHRAATYRDEFLGPILNDIRQSYTARIVEIASKELDPKKRSEAITSLSTAVRILDNIEAGLDAAVNDGKVAEKSLLKAEKVEKMSAPQRRLLGFAPY